MARNEQRPRRARSLLQFLVLGLVVVSVYASLARAFWPAELLASFGWHQGWFAAALSPLAALLRAPRTALVLLLLCGWHVHAEVSTWLPVEPPEAQGDAIRVASVNVLWGNQRHEDVVQWVRAEAPDVIAFCELSLPARGHFEEQLSAWPHRVRWPITEEEWTPATWGLALFSKLPLEAPTFEVSRLGKGNPILGARVRRGTTELHVRSLHAMRPGRAYRNEIRRGVLERLAELSREEPRTVAVGDFNLAPTSPWFPWLLDASGLRDSRPGFGRQATWATPSWSGRWWIPIDHVLVGSRVQVLDRRTSEIPGSDHRAVLIDLQAR